MPSIPRASLLLPWAPQAHPGSKSRARDTNILMIVCILLTLAPSGGLWAQPCVEYRNYFHTEVRVPLGGVRYSEGNDIVIVAPYAYVAEGRGAFEVVDIADPSSPVIVGSVETPGGTKGGWAVAVKDGHAYVADGPAGLQVIDISNPGSPKLVGGVDTPGSALGIAVTGDYAYVADGDDVQIVDISVPAQPVIVAETDSLRAVKIELFANYALVAGGVEAHILDLSDLIAPTLVGSVGPVWGAQDVDIVGGYAYISGYDFYIVDVTSPSQPRIVATLELFDPGGIAVDGDHAFVANRAEISAYDISDPAQPRWVASTRTLGFGRHYGAAVRGQHAYFVGNDGLVVVDISNPVAPPLLGQVSTPGHAQEVDVANGLVYVADREGGLLVVDVSDPTTPIIVGQQPGDFVAVAVRGTIAWVAELAVGLHGIDVSSPEAPELVSTLELPLGTQAVDVWGDHVYVTRHVPEVVASDSLLVIDVSDPLAPRVVGSAPVAPLFISLVADGPYVYAVSNNWMSVIDVADPTSPVIQSRIGLHTAYDIAVSNRIAYIVDTSHGLFSVIDVANPSSPDILYAENIIPGSSIAAVGNWAYLASDRTWALDVSDPGSPAIYTGLSPEGAHDIEVHDGVVYLAAGSRGLVLHPADCGIITPTVLQLFEVIFQPEHGVVLAWEVSERPTGPRELVFLRAVAGASGSWTIRGRVHTARGTFRDADVQPGITYTYAAALEMPHGWDFLETRQVTVVAPGMSRLLGNRPDPFNPRTRIRFELAHADVVHILVFDVRGQFVRELVSGPLPAGTHELVWDGRDGRGRPAASGVYLYAIRGARWGSRERMTLVR